MWISWLVYLARSKESASDTFSAHEWSLRWSGLVRCLHFWGVLIRSLQTHAACAGRPSESRYESNNGAPSQSDGSFVRSTKHDRSVKWGTTFLGRPTYGGFTTFLWWKLRQFVACHLIYPPNLGHYDPGWIYYPYLLGFTRWGPVPRAKTLMSEVKWPDIWKKSFFACRVHIFCPSALHFPSRPSPGSNDNKVVAFSFHWSFFLSVWPASRVDERYRIPPPVAGQNFFSFSPSASVLHGLALHT